jgi:hypothetical protein
MWGNPTREREIYYSASGKYSTAAKSHFQPREITYSTQTVPPKSASFSVPSPYCCTTLPEMAAPRKQSQQSAVRTFLYIPAAQNSLKIDAKPCLKIRALSSCCTDCKDPYNMSSNSRKITQPQNIKSFLGICALAPLENVPSLLLTFLSQAYLENLSCSFSQCVLHTTQCILL